ncbi:MAG: hypothetical protein R3D63_17080 [Paracoccaceae bacterium]
MRIRLVGVFEVTDDAGRDCTPRGSKACALLAMLCQTPDRRRPRRWLEGKLWSDRGAEQASGSLRQALMELRKALGPLADRLVADRSSVALGPVTTDLDTAPAEAAEALRSGREFLEGIDIVDAAFLDWLREERQRVAAQLGLAAVLPAPPQADVPRRTPFVLRQGSLPDGPGAFIARDLAQAIARLAAEFLHLDLYDATGGAEADSLPREGLDLHIEGAWIQNRAALMVSLIARASQQTVWSQRLTAASVEEVAEGQGDVPSVVFEAVEAAMMQMPRLAETEPGAAVQVNARIARAMAEMFSYDAARLRLADQLLQEAAALMPSDRICAWRSLVRQIMFVERTEPDPEALRDQSDALARTALEMTDGTPLVLALISLTRVMVDENPEAGTVLAQDATRRSPFNPFGFWAMAAANIRHGLDEQALASARRGVEIASRTPIVHSWEGLAGLAALRAGHPSAAIAHYEAAHYRAPNFRAGMRHLVYLYLEDGARTKAARVLKALLRAEPDFSPAALLDPDYPAHTLRRAGLAQRHAETLQEMIGQLAVP